MFVLRYTGIRGRYQSQPLDYLLKEATALAEWE